MKYLYIFLGLVVILGLFIFWPRAVSPVNIQYKTTTLTIAGEQFTAEIADTPALQQLGLSYRTGIGQNDAMLFAFPQPMPNLQFWMKDMNFPLDIIWLDSTKHTIYIEKNLSPVTYPQSFGPTTDSQYVIEVASGTADRLGLKVGDQVSF